MTHKSRTDRLRVFKHGSKVDHMTRHAQHLFKAKRSNVKVTKSRDVSADKNAITRQCTVISPLNWVGIIDVVVDACGILYRASFLYCLSIFCGYNSTKCNNQLGPIDITRRHITELRYQNK